MHTYIKISVGLGLLIAAGAYGLWGYEHNLYEPTKEPTVETARPATNQESQTEAPSEGGRGELDIAEVMNDDAPQTDISFAHVAPGEYSEIYFILRGEPGEAYSLQLWRPGLSGGIDDDPYRSGTLPESGEVRLTWRINQYGEYSVLDARGSIDDMSGPYDRQIRSIEVK